MKNLKYVSSVLFVKDINTSKKFYLDVLRQEIQFDFGKNVMFKGGFAIWEVDANHDIGKEQLNKSNASSGFELYFETEKPEEIKTALINKNIKFLHNLKEEKWGQRTIRFFDPDGHIIEVGERMEILVRRLKRQMDDKQISSKTGLSLDEIKLLLANDEF